MKHISYVTHPVNFCAHHSMAWSSIRLPRPLVPMVVYLHEALDRKLAAGALRSLQG
ncbi:MAG: hypothetical protein ABI833_11490 [Acidobacteriota bacterium]